MSINSKARRDTKKRKALKERNLRAASAPKVEGHAELRDGEGNLVAGVVRRGDVWFLGLDGRMAGSSDSAAEVFALLKRAGKTYEANGVPVRMVYSDELRDTAELEAATQGMTLDEYDTKLGAEIAERGKDAAETDASLN